MHNYPSSQWLDSLGLIRGKPGNAELAIPGSPLPAGQAVDQWLPAPGETCHGLFQISSAADATDRVHGGVIRLVRTLNLMSQAEVACRAVVVVAGPATPCVLKSAAYRERVAEPSLEENPNAPWWNALRQQGVPVLVCLQALAAQGLSLEEVEAGIEPVQSGLSAALALGRHGFVPLNL
ncbi:MULTISPECIES: DsrE family protein [unclassified Modicisalibacter]|uniref:DsrE family protein n=1 Tax=unclassified Modicisalibacter TaxID=2679913 RepID=UPI001CCE913B|nr:MULTISPECIES: DsrE family protein [unclassified Modicisalibacter]MBZ9559107.1 DsrE family protein [Modicisalibacter sp. R2A 31.J]MBZ9576782.1 DsrE family protein [Modicisalibacter sp. MOD 31.J]